MPVAPGTSMLLAICVSLEIDISFNSARFRRSSLLMSLAEAFSGGASAVAVVVVVAAAAVSAALPSPLALLAFVAAVEVRVRGVRCDISILLFGSPLFPGAATSVVMLLRLMWPRCCQFDVNRY